MEQSDIVEQQRSEINRLKELNRCLEAKTQQIACRLPDDPPIGTHGYGARMVGVAVSLAKAVGLRGAERVLKIMFDWLEVE